MSMTDPTPPTDVLRHAPDGIVVVEGSSLQLLYANETLASLCCGDTAVSRTSPSQRRPS